MAGAAARGGGAGATRSWVLAGLVADAGDALVVGAAVARGRVRRGPGAAVVLVAALAAALQAQALLRGSGGRPAAWGSTGRRGR